MPFHIFLSQSISLVTGGLSVWKVGKDVILAAITLFAICMVWGRGKSTRQFRWLLGISALYALLHLLLWAKHPDVYTNSAILGLTYNLRLVCFVLLGYAAVLLYPNIFRTATVYKITIGVSTAVAILGVIQYFLPPDFLTHFGYSLERGVRPAFFIDNRPNFPRIMSTLRDPNSLGAYLLVPIALLTSYLLRSHAMQRRLLIALVLLVQLVAVALTFSRSAWLAVVVDVGLVIWWQYRKQFIKLAKRWWPALMVLALLLGAAGYAGRNTYFERSVVSHRTGTPQGAYDSNGFHWFYVKRGLQGVAHQPLGHGPGTAGLASIQDPKGGVLTENYYVQIGYEVGVLGLITFITLNAIVYVRLWSQRQAILPNALLASFWAYVVMNMLLHTWSNEAVACQWWLLAGLMFLTAHGGQSASTK